MNATVPEDKKPGDKFDVTLPTQVTVEVPEKAKAGDEVVFVNPADGMKMKCLIPEGKKGGDEFTVPISVGIPRPTMVTLTVPEGAEPGQTLAFDGPSREKLQAVVPPEKKPGDTFQVPLPPPQQPPLEVIITVPE